MVYCDQCSAEISHLAKYCPFCKAKQSHFLSTATTSSSGFQVGSIKKYTPEVDPDNDNIEEVSEASEVAAARAKAGARDRERKVKASTKSLTIPGVDPKSIPKIEKRQVELHLLEKEAAPSKVPGIVYLLDFNTRETIVNLSDWIKEQVRNDFDCWINRKNPDDLWEDYTEEATVGYIQS